MLRVLLHGDESPSGQRSIQHECQAQQVSWCVQTLRGETTQYLPLDHWWPLGRQSSAPWLRGSFLAGSLGGGKLQNGAFQCSRVLVRSGLSRVASDAAKKRSPFSHRLPLTASSTKRPSGTRDSGRQCHLVLHFGWRLRRAGTLHAQRWKHVRCGLPSTSPLRCSRLRTKFRTLDSVFNSDLIVNTCLHSGYISTAAVSQLQTFSGCQQIMSDCIAANTRLKNVVLFFSFVICIASYSVSSTFVSTASLAATLQPSSCKVLQSLFSCLTSLAMLCASVNISVLSTFYSTPPVSAHEEP